MRSFTFSRYNILPNEDLSKSVRSLSVSFVGGMLGYLIAFVSLIAFIPGHLENVLGFFVFLVILVSLFMSVIRAAIDFSVDHKEHYAKFMVLFFVMLGMYIISLINLIPMYEKISTVLDGNYFRYLNISSDYVELLATFIKLEIFFFTPATFVSCLIQMIILVRKINSTDIPEHISAILAAQRLIVKEDSIYGVFTDCFNYNNSMYEFEFSYDDIVSVEVRKGLGTRYSANGLSHNLFINCKDSTVVKLLVDNPYEASHCILQNKYCYKPNAENQPVSPSTQGFQGVQFTENLSDELPDLIYCPHCGRKQSSDRDICLKCGKKMYK